MMHNPVKLADLIEIGRASARGRSQTLKPVDDSGQAMHWPSGPTVLQSMPIASDLERLGEELLSISRTGSDNPRALMRDALRSIEACLVSIRHQSWAVGPTG